MQLSKELKKAFQNSLMQEKNSFYEETKKLFNEAENDLIYYPFLFGSLSRNYPEMYNGTYARNIIDATFKLNENPSLENEVYFRLQGVEKFFDLGTQEMFNLKYDQILKRTLKEFSKPKNGLNLPNISNIPIFLDLIMDREDAEKFHIKYLGQVFNIDGWVDHIKSLTALCYDGFEFSNKKSTNNIFRFVKTINDNFHIALEYDNKEVMYQLKRNLLNLPEIKIIFFNNDFKKSTKFKGLENDTIWRLGSIENPFFNLQSSLVGYYLRLTSTDNIDKTFSGRTIAFKDKIGENKYRIYNDSNLSEALNLFAFYEFFVSSKYNMSYINYLERSLKNIIY